MTYEFGPALKLIAADPMERSHLQFLKWTLGVHKKASNVGCWVDTGRVPIGLTIIAQLLSYFENLKSRGIDGSLIGHAFIEQGEYGTSVVLFYLKTSPPYYQHPHPEHPEYRPFYLRA